MKDIFRDFSRWTPWDERFDLDLSQPGVYLIGRFTLAPRGKPSPTSKLIYIGETCGQALARRLYQFKRSAFTNKFAHSGGSTFWKQHKLKKEPGWLYISVLSVKDTEPTRSAYIRYVERSLIWNHVARHGALPKCNRK